MRLPAFRRPLNAVVSGTLVAYSLVGCAPTKQSTTETTAVPAQAAKIEVVPPKVEEPPKDAVNPGIGKYGGSLTSGLISDPKTFNYFLAQELSSTTPLSLIVEGLAEVNSITGKVQPDLAEKWDVAPDNMTYTFTLRKGLKWSDGAPLTADDVDFTFNQIVFNPRVPTDTRDVLMVDGKLPTVKKIDDLHIQVKTPEPFAPFLRTFGVTPIMPKHTLASTLKNDAKGNLIFNSTWTLSTDITKIPSSGPFVFSEFVPGQRIVYKRNPRYFRVDPQGNRLPYLDKVVFLIVKDQNAGLLKFQSGETDMEFIDAPLRGQDFAAMKPQEKSGNFTIYKAGPDFGTLFLTFNQNVAKDPSGKPYVNPVHEKWFRDVKFREALAHAIDKQSIIRNVYQGIAIPQIAAESQTSPFYNDKVPTYDYNLDEAQKLLTEAGYKKDASGILHDPQGNAVTFTLNTNVENNERMSIAQILMDDFKKLGIKVKFQPLNFNVLVEKTARSLDWEAVLMGFTGSLDPAQGANIWTSRGRVHMFNQYLPDVKMTGWEAQSWEKQIDQLFEQGATTLDENKRKEIYDKYQVIAAEQLPYIYIVNRIQLFPVRNVFGNLDVTPIGQDAWNIFSLYRTDLK